MTAAAPDAEGFVFEPLRGPKRRVEFEPCDDHWMRIESVWTGCAWRETGREPVQQVRRA